MNTDQNETTSPLANGSDQAGAALSGAAAMATDLEQQARTLIRQRPVVAVLTAIGVGYLVARLAARVTR